MPNDTWRTPYTVIDLIRRTMNSIDCDPCTSEYANRYIQAPHYFTCERDGLTAGALWRGNVFLNPPYSANLVKRFTAKAIQQHEAQVSQQTMILVNCCTDTSWFHALIDYAQRCEGVVMFTRKRLSFLYPDSEFCADQNRVGQTFVYYGNRQKIVKETLHKIAYEIG